MRKYDLISALSAETSKEVARNEESWKKYLNTASRLYKYPFKDQLLIYAQRPDATACASIEIWNEKMHCWVNKGAKGIALIDEEGSPYTGLRYVFDISDVHKARRIGRFPQLWEMKEEHQEAVLDRLEGIYGETSKEAGFTDRIRGIAARTAQDCYGELASDMEYLKEHVDAQTACVLIQHPNYYGNLEEAAEIGEITHGAGAKYVMNVNPISLGVVKTPAEYGADVAVGEGQPLGLSIAFGGPYLGFMAATQKMMRNLPGRIVGQTEDHNGKKGYVLTLQAREQHIRREKASSNICSNQALCALAVGVYLATMGNEGIKKAATLSTSKAHYLSAELAKVGYQTENKGEFFHEFVTVSDVPAAKALAALEEKGILGGFPLDEHRILWCCTEVNTKEEMDAVVQILKEVQ